MTPFVYPQAPHVRRHGPQGYADPASFRPFLRDEFDFRCIYCLVREQWGRVDGTFEVDHFLPAVYHPTEHRTYENLLYACATCNAYKHEDLVPDPCVVLIQKNVEVRADGELLAKTPEADRLVRLLDLNSPAAREFRVLWMEIVALAKEHNAALHRA